MPVPTDFDYPDYTVVVVAVVAVVAVVIVVVGGGGGGITVVLSGPGVGLDVGLGAVANHSVTAAVVVITRHFESID